jgi:hypothetical protein
MDLSNNYFLVELGSNFAREKRRRKKYSDWLQIDFNRKIGSIKFCTCLIMRVYFGAHTTHNLLVTCYSILVQPIYFYSFTTFISNWYICTYVQESGPQNGDLFTTLNKASKLRD